MAKIKNKPTLETPAPDQDVPAPDLSALRADIIEKGKSYFDAEDTASSCVTDMVIRIREEREEQPTIERDSVRLVIQEAVAEIRGLKLEHVQSAPDKKLKLSKPEDYAKRNSSYVLVSTLLSIAWPKDEKQDAKVAKAIESGEDRFTVLKKLASKPNKTTQSLDPDRNKITDKNFAEKLKAFLTKYATDTGNSIEEALDKAELEAIPAIREEIAKEDKELAKA